MIADSKVSYRIDRDDRVIYLNEEWNLFALANDGAEIISDNVIGRPLWDFITNSTTEQLYRKMIHHVRSGRSTNFAFRCDAPERRRYLQMTITAESDNGEVQFESRTIREEVRAPQALLNRRSPRSSNNLLRICGWCKRVDLGDLEMGRWGEIEEAVAALYLFEQEDLPLLTHGMCNDCYQLAMKEIFKLKASA